MMRLANEIVAEFVEQLLITESAIARMDVAQEMHGQGKTGWEFAWIADRYNLHLFQFDELDRRLGQDFDLDLRLLVPGYS